jgi:uncharacterized protein YodC (DUF2158 family)
VDYQDLPLVGIELKYIKGANPMDFQPGDTVQLKSGGPTMTISKIEDFNSGTHAICTWFAGTKREVGTFSLATLKHVDA